MNWNGLRIFAMEAVLMIQEAYIVYAVKLWEDNALIITTVTDFRLESLMV